MHTQRAAGYPFDPVTRRFLVQVPCWLSTVELMAFGHALALADGAPLADGMSVLGSRCLKHGPDVRPEMLDRGDWQDVVASAFRARFDPTGLPSFLGDYGWSLDLAAVRAALSGLDRQQVELHAALSRELQLADLLRERLSLDAGGLPLDWLELPLPPEELPAVIAARQAEHRPHDAASLDRAPAPDALALLEARARSEVMAMIDHLKELLSPVRSAEELPALLRGLRRLLVEADRLRVGVYLGFS